MNKENFKNPKARYTGNDLFEQDRELTDSMNKNASGSFEELPKTHSLTILKSYVDKMRDYVHLKKVNGSPYYTQGQLVQDALDMYFNSLGIEIPQRPEHVMRAEKRRTGRRKSSSNSKNSSDDLGFND